MINLKNIKINFFNLKNLKNNFFRYRGANITFAYREFSVEVKSTAHSFTEKTQYRICITPDTYDFIKFY